MRFQVMRGIVEAWDEDSPIAGLLTEIFTLGTILLSSLFKEDKP